MVVFLRIMEVFVGTCGWSVKGGKKDYCKLFDTIEVQETFYKLPKVETVKKWREVTHRAFVFNMKAWQVVTHPPSSPTWRRSGLKIPSSKINQYGSLKATEENIRAWEKTLEVAEAMNAKIIVIQTPASFNYNQENLNNVKEFLCTARRGGSLIGWEPRGDWRDHLDEVRRICMEQDILHITDPFRCENVSEHPIRYYRLHGIGGKEVNYKYNYSVDDFRKLIEVLNMEKGKGVEEAYVMFNNVNMREDALNFKNLILKTFHL